MTWDRLLCFSACQMLGMGIEQEKIPLGVFCGSKHRQPQILILYGCSIFFFNFGFHIYKLWLSQGLNKIIHVKCLAQRLEWRTCALSGGFSLLLFSDVYSFRPSLEDKYFFHFI